MKRTKMPCGLFDLVSPNYGKPALVLEGPLRPTDNRVLNRQPHPYTIAELAALRETRAFLKDVAAFRRAAPPFDPTPRLRRAITRSRFVNHPHA